LEVPLQTGLTAQKIVNPMTVQGARHYCAQADCHLKRSAIILERHPQDMSSTALDPPPRSARILGVPSWLFWSLATILAWGAWGAVSKVASGGVDADTNQIFYTLGLIPLVLVVMLRSSRLGEKRPGRRTGIAWAFLTGILGGTGNIAFFHALVIGGKASIVVPATALFPLVTVILAVMLLHERVSAQQKIGLVLALGAIYLLSM
jgi:bacterial/archaeal transporter family protein